MGDGDNNLTWALFLLLLWMLGCIVYFAPSIIAKWCYRRQTVTIFIVNLFLGWTFIGWVVALAWAFMKDEDEP